MSLKSLLGTAVIAGVIFGAGFYCGKPKEVRTDYLDWNLTPDVVVSDEFGYKSIFMGAGNGRTVNLSDASYAPEKKRDIRKQVGSNSKRKNLISQTNPKQESDFKIKPFLRGLLD